MRVEFDQAVAASADVSVEAAHVAGAGAAASSSVGLVITHAPKAACLGSVITHTLKGVSVVCNLAVFPGT